MHEFESQHRELAEAVDKLTRAEELEHTVATAIRNERRALLTWPRKIGAGALALLVAAPALHDLVLWTFGG